MAEHVHIVLTLPRDSDVKVGDIVRFEQAETEDARLPVGGTVSVARILKEPHEMPGGHIGFPVEMRPESEGDLANVVVQVEAKKHLSPGKFTGLSHG